MPQQDFGYVDPDRILAPGELQKFLTAAKCSGPRDYAIVMLFVTSRFSALEVNNFKWGDLIHDINGNWGARVKSKGRNNYRIIPIRKEAAIALGNYRAGTGLPPSVHFEKEKDRRVFLNRYDEPISETGVRKIIYRICEKAGLKRISPKDLGHLCVIYGRIYHADAGKLQFQAGFSDAVLLKKYDYVVHELLNAACNVIQLPEH